MDNKKISAKIRKTAMFYIALAAAGIVIAIVGSSFIPGRLPAAVSFILSDILSKPAAPTNAHWVLTNRIKTESLVLDTTDATVAWGKSESDNVDKQLLMIYSDSLCKNTIQSYTLDKNSESFHFEAAPNSTIYFEVSSFNAQAVGSSTACSNGLHISADAISSALYSFPFIDPNSGINYTLSLYEEDVNDNSLESPLYFLDDVFNYDKNQQTREVLAGVRGNPYNLYISEDLGLTWNFLTRLSYTVSKGFTTSDGTKILWDSSNHRLMRLAYDGTAWQSSQAVIVGKNSEEPAQPQDEWLGPQSIGQHNNVIMFGEYWAGDPSGKDTVRVYRSKDDGKTWEAVFSMPTKNNPNVPLDQTITHFHTLQPDPYYPGNWYLSSGDFIIDSNSKIIDQNRVWLTKDDGDTWTEVTNPKDAMGMYRYNSLIFDKNQIIWSTDNIMFDVGQKGHAKLVKVERTEPLTLYESYNINDLLVRNTVSTPLGYLTLSENAFEYTKSGFEIGLLDNNNTFMDIGFVPGKGTFTSSEASRTTIDDTFLSRFQVYGSYDTILRWEIRRTNFNNSSAEKN